MHEDHEVFVGAVKDSRKVILTYHSGLKQFYITKSVIPVYHRPSGSEWAEDIYYFWDSHARRNRLLILHSSHIKFMELSGEFFAKADYKIEPESSKDC